MLGIIAALLIGGAAALGLGGYFGTQQAGLDWNKWMPWIIGGTVVSIGITAVAVVYWRK